MRLLNGNRTYRKFRFSFLVLIVIILSMLSFYWLKNQVGINVFYTLSLSNYFPFKYLNRSQIISADQQGILLSDDFDKPRLINNWHGIFTEEKGKVIQRLSSSSRNDSRCLLIINREVENWSVSHNYFIAVNLGNQFTYSARVEISGRNPVANICVDSFDENMKIMTWGYSKAKFEELNKWVKLVKTFSITDKDVKYIRFRINGVGKGEYRFDDIVLKRKP